MQPTINKDFTPQQIKRYNEQESSRKGNEPIEMQCLKVKPFTTSPIMRITVWQAGLIERLRIAITGKVYLSMTGKPMVWVDVKKPYNTNQLIQGIDQPKREKEQPKKLVALGDADVLTAGKGSA